MYEITNLDSARTTPSSRQGLDYEDEIGHLHGDSEFSGPVSARKCTDLSYLIIFLLANLGLIAVSIYTLINGDPNRLTKGFDLRGNICGLGPLGSKRFMYFPNSTNTDWSLCIEACPYYYYENYYCIYDKSDTTIEYPEWGCFDAYETTAYGFFCVPASTGRQEVFTYLSKSMEVIRGAVGDIFLVWDTIFVGYCFSLTVGLTYLLLLRISKVAMTLVIITVFLLNVFLGGLVFLLFQTANRALGQNCGSYGPVTPEYCNRSTYWFYTILAIIVSTWFAVYMCRVYKKYPNFRIGYQMIALTSKPLSVMRELALFPVAQILVGNSILLMLIIILGWNMSSFAKVKVEDPYIPGGQAVTLQFSALENYMLAFNAGMSIWWCFFIVDLGKFVMSGGVSIWYFLQTKVSFIRSIAMGSLCKLLRIPFDGLNIGRLNQYLKSEPATTFKLILSKICIPAKFFNYFIRYITEYNYTFMSIFADNYTQAGKKAYHLMRRNNVRIGRPCKFGTFIINMMKWVIIFSGTSASLLLILYPEKSPSGQLNIELTGLSGPILCSFILSWFIGEVFGGALEVSLNTVLLSAACDEEMFVREQRFVESDLLEFMDGIGEEQNANHQENKSKIRSDNSSTKFSINFSKVEPDVLWSRSKNTSYVQEYKDQSFRTHARNQSNASINYSHLNPCE